MSVFGDRTKQAREAAGLSQAQLADMAGVTQSAIANLEADRSGMSCATLVKVADALEVSADWLLGREPLRQEITDEEIIAEFNPAVWATLSESDKKARIDMVRKMRRSGRRLY